ncbi:unnamed protein product [Owenia fusiformis]|uniref:BTB domain-containing protein n=1 Tax=Owenia fusiformis TaxID=6347 RepID=A0A8S4Q6Q5_OWEFU|nr:unnamed protein product [Owenia fusiformis]
MEDENSLEKSIKKLIATLKDRKTSNIYNALVKLRTKYLKAKNGITIFRENEGIKVLLHVIRKNMETQKMIDISLSILGNCCMEVHSREQVIGEGGLHILVSLCEEAEIESIQNRACRTIANLCLEDTFITDVHRTDIVEFIIEFLRQTKDNDCKMTYLRTLRLLCNTEQHCKNVLKFSGMVAIAMCLKTEDPGVKRASLRGIVEILQHRSTRDAVSQLVEADICGPLFQLLDSDDTYIKKLTLQTILTLVNFSDIRPSLGNAGVVELFITKIKDSQSTNDSKLIIPYLNSLCLFCHESVNRAKVRNLNGLELLLGYLQDDGLYSNTAQRLKILNALICFIYDEQGMNILLEKDLVKILVVILKKENQPNDEPLDLNKEDKPLKEEREENMRKDKKCEEEDTKEPQTDNNDSNEIDKTLVISDSEVETLLIDSKHRETAPVDISVSSYIGISSQDSITESTSTSSFKNSSTLCTAEISSIMSQSTTKCPNSNSDISPIATPANEIPINSSPVAGSSWQIPGPSSPPISSSQYSPRSTVSYFSPEWSPEHSMAYMYPYSPTMMSPTRGGSPVNFGTFSPGASPQWSLSDNNGQVSPQWSPVHSIDNAIYSSEEEVENEEKQTANEVQLPATLDEELQDSDKESKESSDQSDKAKDKRLSFSEEKEEVDCIDLENEKQINHVEHKILILLSAISHMEDPTKYLCNKDCLSALLGSVKASSSKDSRAFRVLTRIFRNPLCLEKLILLKAPLMTHQHLCTDIDDIIKRTEGGSKHEKSSYNVNVVDFGERLLESLRMVATGGYGKGVMSHAILTGSFEQQREAAISLVFLCARSAGLQKQLLLDMKVITLLLESLGSDNSSFNCDITIALHYLAKELNLEHVLGSNQKNKYLTSECNPPGKKRKLLSDAEINECVYETTRNHHDLKFSLDGGIVTAQRANMVDQSDVFTAMLSGHYAESSQTEIDLPKVGMDAFRVLVHAIHGCSMQCHIKNIPTEVKLRCLLEAFRLADQYNIPIMHLELADVIFKGHINVSNTDLLYQTAKLHHCEQLAHNVLSYALLADVSPQERTSLMASLYDNSDNTMLVEDFTKIFTKAISHK